MSEPSASGVEALYAVSYRRLVGQLTAMTGDVAEAEDLVQEAFARAVAQWSKLRDYEDPESWLRTVAMNLARSRWRRGKRTAAVMLRLRAAHEDVRSPSPDHVALVHALRDLPAGQREALVLFHVADLPVDVIARDLGVPSGTVKARLSRGRAALAIRLADPDDDRGGRSYGTGAAAAVADPMESASGDPAPRGESGRSGSLTDPDSDVAATQRVEVPGPERLTRGPARLLGATS